MELTSFTPSTALITVIALALAPFVAVMATSFTKIVVVLSLLRNALGTQQIPPNVVLNGLAMILTIYVMYPVGLKMSDSVADIENIGSDTESLMIAANVAKEPLRDFLVKHSDETDRQYFLSTIHRMIDEEDKSSINATDFVILIPAFTLNELTSAFQIGFMIFLPFIIIDLVISNILMALGMMMLSPTVVSLPFKLLLFVIIEGWAKLLQGLVTSYV